MTVRTSQETVALLRPLPSSGIAAAQVPSEAPLDELLADDVLQLALRSARLTPRDFRKLLRGLAVARVPQSRCG
jgi:hypothetical protein